MGLEGKLGKDEDEVEEQRLQNREMQYFFLKKKQKMVESRPGLAQGLG